MDAPSPFDELRVKEQAPSHVVAPLSPAKLFPFMASVWRGKELAFPWISFRSEVSFEIDDLRHRRAHCRNMGGRDG